MATNYVCAELAPAHSGYVMCKTWVAQDDTANVLTRQQVYEVGGVLVAFFVSAVAYLILTRAIKTV